MTTEVQTEEVKEIEQNDQPQVAEAQEEEAAFSAGFAEGRGEEPPQEAEPKTEEQPEPAAEEPAKEPALIAGLTEEQVKTLLLKANDVDKLAQQIDKAFGKYGELHRTLMQLQQQKSSLSLTPDKLKRLNAEFPEIASMLAEDLSEAIGSNVGSGVDFTEAKKQLDEELQSFKTHLEQESARVMLKRSHRDWQDVIKSPDFGLWVGNVLPKEEAEQLQTSWDAEFISDKLDEFKAWRLKAAESSEKKQKRLEAAVPPRGDRTGPSTAQSEEEAFLSGFKAKRSNAFY